MMSFFLSWPDSSTDLFKGIRLRIPASAKSFEVGFREELLTRQLLPVFASLNAHSYKLYRPRPFFTQENSSLIDFRVPRSASFSEGLISLLDRRFPSQYNRPVLNYSPTEASHELLQSKRFSEVRWCCWQRFCVARREGASCSDPEEPRLPGAFGQSRDRYKSFTSIARNQSGKEQGRSCQTQLQHR